MELSKGSAKGLIPLAVFVVTYLTIAIIARNFYAVSVIIPFLIAALSGIIINRGRSLEDKVESFCKGAGESNIILMCLIFVLAGAFAEVAKAAGAVESTVNLGITLLPENLLVTGIFIIACFISISIGTSMGTIAALTPIATGVSDKTGIALTIIVGAVVGGAMFGDNLSMISDTTIAATRTQGCKLKDKFKMNFKIVLPAAIVTAILFTILTSGQGMKLDGTYKYNIIKIIPYIGVLIAAIAGMNVLTVLSGGIVLAGGIGIFTGSFGIIGLFESMAKGIAGMSELIIISLIIGGIVELIKDNGGIDYILYVISTKIKSKRGAEIGIAALVSLVDICTANNTIAIITVGPIAKNISDKFNLEPKRVAGILDMFSCVFQGLIPYGAQLLLASSLAMISPFQIMGSLFYPYLMGISALIYIMVFPIKEVE
ncbi:Na+/H+ antiporter NhaC family protein [Clostridium fallax]|uniref:Putative methionine transporter, NhaC family n=1 Tax=Clostridium fallax TaxID=1533 RepID=A0A1M4TWW5_9CLOT|nr:putative methionine transporter, NhaC family [Clostridium fallax]SQB22352.1 Na+/H+ antiporter family protein [Clostridium fallax]